MGWYRPKSKWEVIFMGLGNGLYLIVLLLGVLFLFGYAIYQLCTGNVKWFKLHPEIILAIIIFLAIAIGLINTNRQDNKKSEREFPS